MVSTAETYLAAIYLLDEEGVPAVQARLVERLGHRAPTVSEMVGRLRDGGLVSVDRRVLRLTAAGRDLAERAVRRHRLAERFLTDLIGLEWTTAHREANRWQDAISDEVEPRLLQLLGHPTTSSLGTPFPGSPRPAAARPLSDVAAGRPVRIAWLTEALQADEARVAYLAGRGLSPATVVTVETRGPDGTATVQGGRAGAYAVDPLTAKQIFVEDTRTGRPEG